MEQKFPGRDPLGQKFRFEFPKSQPSNGTENYRQFVTFRKKKVNFGRLTKISEMNVQVFLFLALTEIPGNFSTICPLLQVPEKIDRFICFSTGTTRFSRFFWQMIQQIPIFVF